MVNRNVPQKGPLSFHFPGIVALDRVMEQKATCWAAGKTCGHAQGSGPSWLNKDGHRCLCVETTQGWRQPAGVKAGDGEEVKCE